jgi:hypothetical protein
MSRPYVKFSADETTIEVDVSTIDSVMSTNPIDKRTLSFVKLDLEGMELRALQGAAETLRHYRPCCVFENSLQSAEYEADEFFAFFRAVNYQLYDILGCPVDQVRWNRAGPWYFVAMPAMSTSDLLPLLWTSALEELLATHWVPASLQPRPAFFSPPAAADAPVVRGYIDAVESSITVTGWAADTRTGKPVASLVVTVDGTPLATFAPTKVRNDVAVATRQEGFTNSGFEATVRSMPTSRVEVFAELGDGRREKLGGPPAKTVGNDNS